MCIPLTHTSVTFTPSFSHSPWFPVTMTSFVETRDLLSAKIQSGDYVSVPAGFAQENRALFARFGAQLREFNARWLNSDTLNLAPADAQVASMYHTKTIMDLDCAKDANAKYVLATLCEKANVTHNDQPQVDSK